MLNLIGDTRENYLREGRRTRFVTTEAGRGDLRVITWVLSAGNFVQIGARLLISPIVPLVILEFGLSTTGIGLALSGMWATYALSQFPSGVLADRYGAKRIVVTGLIGAGIGCTFVAISPNYPVFFFSVVLLGLGAGFFYSPASSLLTNLASNDGKALSALTAAGALAGLLYPVLGGYMGNLFGWRLTIVVAALLAAVVAVGTLLAVPRNDPHISGQRMSSVSLSRIWRPLSQPAIAYSTFIAALFGFIYQAITSFYPTFLHEYHGLSTSTSGIAFGAIFAFSAISQPIAGRLSDTFSRDVVLTGSALISGIGLAVLLTITDLSGIIIGTILLGIGISWPGVAQARIMDQLSPDEVGFEFGLLRTTYMLLAASGSIIVGVLIDTGGWIIGYGLLVALFTLALFSLIFSEIRSRSA